MKELDQNDIVKALRIIRRNDLPSTLPIELIDDAVQDWMRKIGDRDQFVARVIDNLAGYRACRGSGNLMPGDHVRALLDRQPTLAGLQHMENQ